MTGVVSRADVLLYLYYHGSRANLADIVATLAGDDPARRRAVYRIVDGLSKDGYVLKLGKKYVEVVLSRKGLEAAEVIAGGEIEPR